MNGGWRKQLNEKLRNFYSPSDFITMIKSRIMSGARLEVHMLTMRNMIKIPSQILTAKHYTNLYENLSSVYNNIERFRQGN